MATFRSFVSATGFCPPIKASRTEPDGSAATADVVGGRTHGLQRIRHHGSMVAGRPFLKRRRIGEGGVAGRMAARRKQWRRFQPAGQRWDHPWRWHDWLPVRGNSRTAHGQIGGVGKKLALVGEAEPGWQTITDRVAGQAGTVGLATPQP